MYHSQSVMNTTRKHNFGDFSRQRQQRESARPSINQFRFSIIAVSADEGRSFCFQSALGFALFFSNAIEVTSCMKTTFNIVS